ncbi:pyridoxal-dependent decarboxylase, exosortase A system-associated [Qipengyuania sediminis]|uniref:pyridoxal-dependent decarboxylase, exosortase A system-associated n=1 Tax=Qipengyuania sediminis TaxID=1532023 RepID=UPI00105A0D4C|nr:pyridoxal-dependent decarboxylase, exosortase A system-associated [Qipengyuania sediminis]
MSPKPLGPVPPGFQITDGELAIAGHRASELARAGTPLFVYSSAMIEARVAALREALPARVGVHYAIKANPFPPLLRLMAQLCDGLDIASAGELDMALGAGADASAISFAGPGKSDAELEAAIGAGVTINLESAREADRALAIAARLGVPPKLAVRVNPAFDLRGSGMKMGGRASPFGIDEARAADVIRRVAAFGADYRGLHIYAGSQSLDSGAIVAAQAATLALAERLAQESGYPPPAVNLGGGFGIPYFAGDRPVDIAAVGSALGEAMAASPLTAAGTRYHLELGRWLVGEAGVYLTCILDRKESGGETFLVTDGGLHHQLAASGNFGTVVRRNYPVAIATRMDAPPQEVAHIVGCLCTPLDRLAERAPVPRAEIGDLVAVFCAGAYGASASPAGFLGHGPAAEVLV